VQRDYSKILLGRLILKGGENPSWIAAISPRDLKHYIELDDIVVLVLAIPERGYRSADRGIR
jgi:hypothetical protein